MKLLLIILALNLVFLWDFTSTFTSFYSKKEYKVEYNGLLWVMLDYYSIQKYNSADEPMKWICFTNKSIK